MSEPRERASARARRRLGPVPALPLLELALAVAVAIAAYSLWSSHVREPGIDFYQFWVVGRQLVHAEPTNVWSAAERERLGAEALRDAEQSRSPLRYEAARFRTELETFSTPFLYVVFGFATSSDYDRDVARYRALLIVSLVVALAGLGLLVGAPRSAWLALTLLALIGYAPVESDVLVLNVNSLQLAGLVGVLALAHAEPRAPPRLRGAARVTLGALLGLLIAFKPNLAPIPLVLAGSRVANRRSGRMAQEGAGLVAGLALAVGGSSLVFGSADCWVAWLESLAVVPDTVIDLDLGNFGLAALGRELFGSDLSLVLLPLLGLAALAIVVALRSRVDEPCFEREALLPVALGCGVMLLGSGLVWLHYYVLALPSVVLAVLARPSPGWSTTGAAAAALVGLTPLTALGLTLDPRTATIVASLGASALLGLSVFTVRSPARAGRG